MNKKEQKYSHAVKLIMLFQQLKLRSQCRFLFFPFKVLKVSKVKMETNFQVLFLFIII